MTLTFTHELFKYIMRSFPASVLQQALFVNGLLKKINTIVS